MINRASLAAFAALALCGLSAVSAADTNDAAILSVDDNADLPRFVPDADSGTSSLTGKAIVETAPEESDLGSGVASFYGKRFAGRPTASGETFDPQELTAAHRTLPFGSRVRVTNPDNGRSVVVRINDRGPYAHSRLIDLSRAAAEEVGIVAAGHGTVELALLDD